MIYGVFTISLENSNRLFETVNMHLINETCFDFREKKFTHHFHPCGIRLLQARVVPPQGAEARVTMVSTLMEILLALNSDNRAAQGMT